MPLFMQRFKGKEDQAVLDTCVEDDNPVVVSISVNAASSGEIHWRIVWNMTRSIPATAAARASVIEGWHVMEIFVPNEDNPTGQYLFRRHFRPKGYRSEAGWVTMPIGKLDKTTRATLVEFCSNQDPTHVGNNQNSNCITCVVQSIRAMCISAAEHKIRLATAQSEDDRTGANKISREFDHFIAEDAENAIRLAYAHTRRNS